MMTIKHFAFSLTETLIIIAIIGIVASLTMTVLINKIQDKNFERARQKALLSIGEAGKILAIQSRINDAVDAEDFVKNYLSSHLKIAKYCGTNLSLCNFPSKITKLGGGASVKTPTKISELLRNIYWGSVDKNKIINRTSYAIITGNGYSVNIYYNPYCNTLPNKIGYFYNAVCMNAIYDINGTKKPNEVGKDIGWVTLIGNDETVVAVAPAFDTAEKSNITWTNAMKYCKGNLVTPNYFELESAMYNYNILNFSTGRYWSGNTISNISAIFVGSDGDVNAQNINATSWSYIRCVRK